MDTSRAQQRELSALLHHVWAQSSFYREYYGDHGIRQEDLAHVTVRDLPFLTKPILMDHFDAAVTDRRLRKRELERWFAEHRDPRDLFHEDLIAVTSSGTSGTWGFFVYDRPAWRTVNASASTRLPAPEPGPSGKTRVAFYVSTFGHGTSITTSRYLTPALHDVLLLSMLDPPAQVVERLEAFQPDRLVGYSTAVATLAEWALAGRLRIAPRWVVVGSDRLSESMERTIAAAWGTKPYLLYVATESLYIGIRGPGEPEITVLDDLNIVEILDAEHREVGAGESGRVVLTNLYNYALPVIRYELGDEVVRGAVADGRASSTIRDIQGRKTATLPALMDDGTAGRISSIPLLQIYAAGLRRIQFVSVGPDRVRIDYVGTDDQDAVVARDFARVLATLGARRTAFSVRRVADIPADPRTGKLELVRTAWEADVPAGMAPPTPAVSPAPRVAPTNPFTPFPRTAIEQSVAARFEAQAALHGARPAVVTDGDALTYDALNRAANRLGRALVARDPEGVGPIALLTSHGAPTITAMLAVLKAGKMFVPLDPTFPVDRLRTMLDDARPTLLLTDPPHRELAAGLAVEPARLLDTAAVDLALADDDLRIAIPPDAFAYVLYTSGSTGQPRGVVQSHRNVLHNIMKYTNGTHLAAADRMTMLLSFSFSAAMTNTFGALLNGAALHPFPLRERGITGLAALLRDVSITVFKTVPTTFRLFCRTLAADERFPSLRLVELVGEPVTPGDVDLFRRHFDAPCLLHNRLGATEMHVIRQNFIDARTPIDGAVVPVGYPVDDTEVLIVDEGGQPLPANWEGEIAIRSPFLAVGYWRQPELTAAAFAKDPAGGDARIYRTGDVGVLRADGCLEHHGRKDSQAKIRGQRIEVGEIERALLSVSSARAAVVVVREDGSHDARLVAYLVADGETPPPAAILRERLAATLPGYMIPSAFVWLEALPLAPTGKVDRRALPAPPAVERAGDTALTAPSTPFQEQLLQIWKEVLAVDRIGVDDDFFQLGGHSVLAMQILARVETTFEVNIPLRRFFEASTVATQATLIVQRKLEGLAPADQEQFLKGLDAPPGGPPRGA